jgi:aldehyde:ferredoxin oxidoreductase
MDRNVGGYYGPYLKFSGWDAIELQGKADQDVIIYVDGVEGKVIIYKAPEGPSDTYIMGPQMVEAFADSEKEKIGVSSVSAGPGAENTLIGCLNFSFYDPRRKTVRMKQAGRGGTGTVFRDKRIKALVVKYVGVSKCTKRSTTLTLYSVICAPWARHTWSKL